MEGGEIWNKFSIACTNGDINTLDQLIQNQLIDVNTVDSKGRSGLHMAVCRNQINTVNYLLSKGADPTIKDINNNNPLHLASINGFSNMVSLILNYQQQQQHNNNSQPQNILSKDINNNTPLHLASSRLKRMLTTIKSKSNDVRYNNQNITNLQNELRSIINSLIEFINVVGSNDDKLKMQSIINNFEKDQQQTQDYEMDDGDEEIDENDDGDSQTTLTKTIDDLDSLLNGLSLS